MNTLYKRVSVALVNDEFPEPKFASTETSGDHLVRKPTEPKQAPPPVDPRPPLAGPLPSQADPKAPWRGCLWRRAPVPEAAEPRGSYASSCSSA